MRKAFTGTAKRTTLTQTINNSAVTIQCADLTGWPVSGPFTATLDVGSASEETVLCDSRTGNQLNVNVAGRGYVGAAVSHSAGSGTVRHAPDFNVIDEANRFVNLMTTKGDLVGFDGSLAQRIAAAATDGMVLKKLASNATGTEWAFLGTIPPFTSTGNRDTAIPSPVDGQAWYRNTNDISEGVEFYNGTAYRPSWNMPWGLGPVAQPVDSASTQSNLTSVTDVTSATFTFTSVVRRWLLYHWAMTFELNTASASGSTTIQLTDGSNTILVEWVVLINASNVTVWQHTYDFDILRNEAGGSITRKLRCTGNANGVNIGTFSPSIHVQFSIEDVGPVTGAPA
jgi:hypothetical protein